MCLVGRGMRFVRKRVLGGLAEMRGEWNCGMEVGCVDVEER